MSPKNLYENWLTRENAREYWNAHGTTHYGITVKELSLPNGWVGRIFGPYDKPKLREDETNIEAEYRTLRRNHVSFEAKLEYFWIIPYWPWSFKSFEGNDLNAIQKQCLAHAENKDNIYDPEQSLVDGVWFDKENLEKARIIYKEKLDKQFQKEKENYLINNSFGKIASDKKGLKQNDKISLEKKSTLTFSELKKLDQLDQEKWLNENIADFDQVPFNGELVGYIIQCDDNRLDEYLNYPEDYETGSMIKSVFSELTSSRENEINEGSTITIDEKKYLREAVLEELSNDEFEGENYTVCAVELGDSQLFLTFSGKLIPYPSWSYDDIYETKEQAVAAIKTLSTNERFYRL
jgi:hypothetical protein